MLLVGKVNKVKLVKLIKELEFELGREINFTLFNPQEFKYRRDITDIFLYGILEGKKLEADFTFTEGDKIEKHNIQVI